METGHSSIGEARFCFWGEGELFDWPVMPFPFDAEELAIHERRRLSRFVRKASQSTHVGLAPVTSLLDETAGDSLEPEPGPPPAETQPVRSDSGTRGQTAKASRHGVAGRGACDAAGGLPGVERIFVLPERLQAAGGAHRRGPK